MQQNGLVSSNDDDDDEGYKKGFWYGFATALRTIPLIKDYLSPRLTREELKIKILYSPLVNETTFYLIKRGAITQETTYTDGQWFRLPNYEFKVDHPEYLWKVIIDE